MGFNGLILINLSFVKKQYYYKFHFLILILFFGTKILCQDPYYKNYGDDKTLNEDQSKIAHLLLQSWKNKKTPKKRLLYLDKAFELTIITNDNSALPYIYFNYADFYFVKNNYNLSISYLNKVIEIVDWESHNFLISRVYGYKGYLNQINDEYDKAIDNYKKVLNNSNYNFLKQLSNTNISDIYIKNKMYNVAKPYINNVFKFFSENTKEGLDHPSLAFMYQYKSYYTDDVLEKLKLINKGIILTNNRNAYNKVTAIEFRANFYKSQKKYNLAYKDYKRALELIKKNQLKFQIISSYQSLGNIAYLNNNFKQALKYIDSTSMFVKNEDLISKRINSSIKHKCYLGLNNYKEAYFFSLEEIKYNNSIILKNKDSLYIAYGKKYQTEQKIKENELLKKESVIKDLEVEKQKTNRNYLIAISFLILISLFFAWYKFKEKQRVALKLEAQNTIINQQKIELEKANSNKQKLFSIVAHDLVNPFNAILGYTKLLNEDYESFEDKERKEFINIIDKYATNNYDLTKTLLDWAKIQQQGITVHKENLNCKEVVTTAINPFLILADKKEIQVTLDIKENITVKADNNMMQTVIGNLFVNAVKFTPKKGEINLTITKLKNGTIQLEIEDNGIGMSQKQLNNLFDITKVNTLKGTDNEKGNGLGLVLCKELMNMQSGTLNFISTLHKGSKAIITV